MRYVTRSRAEPRRYGVRDVCTVGRRPKAAKSALARPRGVMNRAIDSGDAKYPGIAMCVALLTALLYFHLAGNPGNLAPPTVHIHVTSPTT
jgi:hypothetical protein